MEHNHHCHCNGNENENTCKCHEHEHKHEHCHCNEHSHHSHTDDNACNCHSNNHHNKCGCHHSHNECGCGHEHHAKTKYDLILFVVGTLLFICSLFMNRTLANIFKIAAVIICGYKILFHGISSLLKLKFDENTLMATAAIACGIMAEFNEAFLIVFLFSIGNFLEEYIVDKSNRQIEDIIDFSQDNAYDENGNKIPAENIKTDDIILVRPGDKFCVDVIITKGYTSVNTADLTGESLPSDCKPGDNVLSGSVNLTNAVVCKATSDYSNSTSAKIKDYVLKSRLKKANEEKFISKFAKIYTPTVIIIAIALAVVLSVFNLTTVSDAVKRGLTFMIASCPCALVISIPLSYFSAIGILCKKGILVKGSRYINTIANVNTIVFDKTGTLTNGKIEVSEVILTGKTDRETILAYAYALEKNSGHPIAQAICRKATITSFEATDITEHFGMGIEGTVDNKHIVIGNSKLADNTALEDGIAVSIDGKVEAVIKLDDKPKTGTKEFINRLKESGIKNTVILSGDNQKKVDTLCSEINISCGFGNLLPTQKAEHIKKMKDNGDVVMFVGDGVNDAPALTEADFSVSVAQGSSLALETGDATLVTNNLNSLISAIKISIHTKRVVYTNIILSLTVKSIVLVLATLGLAPVWLALVSDVGVLLCSVLNSLSILKKKY